MQININLTDEQIKALLVCVKLAQIHLDDDVVLATDKDIETIKKAGGTDYLQNKLDSFKKK